MRWNVTMTTLLVVMLAAVTMSDNSMIWQVILGLACVISLAEVVRTRSGSSVVILGAVLLVTSGRYFPRMEKWPVPLIASGLLIVGCLWRMYDRRGRKIEV